MLPQGCIKVCGITSQANAEAVAELGPTAIGLNLWPQSPRCVDLSGARKIAASVRGRVTVVVVTVDMPWDELARVIGEVEPDYVQLHGHEPDEIQERLGTRAIRAFGVAAEADVAPAMRVAAPMILLDAKSAQAPGGTGQLASWPLAKRVAQARPTLLAGGLGADNVAQAIMAVAPWGVDAASRLESKPGVKDLAQVQLFIERARAAFLQVMRLRGP